MNLWKLLSKKLKKLRFKPEFFALNTAEAINYKDKKNYYEFKC